MSDPASKQIYKHAADKLAGQMCYTIEWRDEDLPLENKEGDAMDTLVQRWINDTQRTPKFLEHFQKPAKEEPPQLDKAPPPAKVSVLVYPDSAGFCQGILDHAPEGRLSTKKIINDPSSSITQEDVKKHIGKGVDLIIFGCGLDMPPTNGIQDIIEHQTAFTRLYLNMLQFLAKNDTLCKRVVVLTRGIFSEDSDLHNAVGLGLVTAGVLFGMTNTARLEYSGAIHFIETEYCLQAPAWKHQDSQLLPRLASEVFRVATFGMNCVRLLHEGRYVLRKVLAQEYEAACNQFTMPTQGGIIAITGGNGALGLVMGDWLLDKATEQQAGGFEIKFLSRSTKVSDQNMPAWSSIQKKAAKLNVKVEQTRCDFSDPEACDSFVADCTPNLYGIIHSAGILEDKLLMNISWDNFEAVWNPKHRAALYLHNALEQHSNPNLHFFWMFSSSSVYGNMGQINYSASNSYLDALCRHRRATGRPAKSIQWGAWGEVGMAANLDQASKKRFAESPQPPFATKEGLAGLEAGLRTGLPGVCVCKYNAQVMFEAMKACEHTTQCYARNFTSEFCPTTGAPSLDRFHLYTMYRLLREGYYGGPTKGLIYSKFIKPELEDELDSSWW